MKNLIAFPPNYKEVLAKFPFIKGKPVVFTYDDILYNPTGADISSDLKVHEETHSRQQKIFRGGAKMWWKSYLFSPEFRLDQEAKAYRAQYCYILVHSGGQKNRGQQVRKAALIRFAEDLSGKIYGKICSYELALRLISKI